MNSFRFFIERKSTIWQRDSYLISANSYEEAVEKMEEEFECESYEEENGFIETESLYDTQDDMTVEENQGSSTRELIYVTDKGKRNTIRENGIIS